MQIHTFYKHTHTLYKHINTLYKDKNGSRTQARAQSIITRKMATLRNEIADQNKNPSDSAYYIRTTDDLLYLKASCWQPSSSLRRHKMDKSN